MADIILGRNKKPEGPVELQHYNPLGCRVGQSVSFQNDLTLSGINFFVEGISVYETKIGAKKFYHTDYWLRGVTMETPQPIRLHLRVIPNADTMGGFDFQCLWPKDESGWDDGLFNALNDESHVFQVHEDDAGNSLEDPWSFQRIDGAVDPYKASLTVLRDKNGDGKVDENEAEKSSVSYWDYSRDDALDLETNQTFREFLYVDMNNDTRYFTIYRGRAVEPSQVMVI